MLNKFLKYKIFVIFIFFFANYCFGEVIQKENLRQKSIISSNYAFLSNLKIFSKETQSRLIFNVMGNLQYNAKWNKTPYSLNIMLEDIYAKNDLNINFIKKITGVRKVFLKKHNNKISIDLVLASNFQAKAIPDILSKNNNNLVIMVYKKPEMNFSITYNKKVKVLSSKGLIKPSEVIFNNKADKQQTTSLNSEKIKINTQEKSNAAENNNKTLPANKVKIINLNNQKKEEVQPAEVKVVQNNFSSKKSLKKKKKSKTKKNTYAEFGDDSQNIYLVVGESKIINYPNLKRTAIGNPAIADVLIISDKELLINGKANGTTSLTLWGEDKRVTYKIIVKKDKLSSKIKVFNLKNFWLKKYDYKTEEGKFQVIISTNTAMVSELQKSLGTILPDTNFSINTELNNVVVQGSPQELKKAAKLLKKLDKEPLQVLFEAKILEVTDAVNKELELNWLTQKNKYSGTFDAGATATTAGTAGGTITFDSLGALSEQYMLNIRALEDQRKVNVLANPKMLTTPGKLANILVGDKLPITTTSVDTTGSRTTSVEYIEVGVILRLVVTSFSSDGFVSVFVTPEVSTLTGFDTQGFPLISVRTENSEVRLKDGESLVIGGLLSVQDIENLSKIPILGDLPFLGKLFQNKNKSKSNQEIILILTPHILNTDNTFKLQPTMQK